MDDDFMIDQKLVSQEPKEYNDADSSSNCPIVLVSGFLGPNNARWCEMYWGEAAKQSTESSPVIVMPVSCVGSAHDRACEIFAQLLGIRVDYGEKHSHEAGHDRFGKDFSQDLPAYSTWSAKNPIHIVGHSFGGNTVRAFKYLVATDFWGIGTSAAWVRSTTTLSSPLKGSLLTYQLGAAEDHTDCKPVRRFSPGYMLGMTVHFYELFCHKTKLDQFFDFGMSQWNVESGGLRFFIYSLLGGHNGGGTPAVCARDNAAHDMTIQAALEWNERIAKAVEDDPNHIEFNFVANKKGLLDYSLIHNTKKLLRPPSVTSLSSASISASDSDIDDEETSSGGDSPAIERKLSDREANEVLIAEVKTDPTRDNAQLSDSLSNEKHSIWYRGTLFLRDFWVYHLANRVFASSYTLQFEEKRHHEAFSVENYIESGGDGLCNAYAQFESHFTLSEEELASRKAPFAPGQYTVLMNERHDHFSVVPFPDSTSDQRNFFQRVFGVLRALPCPEP